MFRGLILSGVVLLAACMEMVPDQQKQSGVDATDVTDITDVTATGAGPVEASPESAGEPAQQEAAKTIDDKPAEPLDMRLEYEGSESADYLFAEKEDTPNYFRSTSDKEGLELKGKLYMIEEPNADKRMQNIDGAEIGVRVPLR